MAANILPKVGNDNLIAAIRLKRGNLAAVARDLGISRTALWYFVQKRPTLKAVHEEQIEIKLDDAEASLDDNCSSGDTNAIKYFLDTMGRKRGYGQVIKVATDKEESPRDALMDKLKAMHARITMADTDEDTAPHDPAHSNGNGHVIVPGGDGRGSAPNGSS